MNHQVTLTLRKKANQTSIFLAVAVFLAMPLSSSALAQSNAGEIDNVVEEIIVTGTKRATNLQDTPISISALTQEGLEQRGVDDFLDFVGSVPGLSLRDNGPGQTRPIIRGLFGVGESQVGVYFDETPVSSAPGTNNNSGRFSPEIKPFDVERVEILKGPQGTLYGGGSMSGTIRFILNKPDATQFSSKISAETSVVNKGDMGYQFNGLVNVPLVKDVLALRVGGYRRYDGGFIDNVTLDKKDINDVDTKGGRIALRFTLNDSFALTATAHVQDQNVGGGFHFIASGRDAGTLINGKPSPLVPADGGSDFTSNPRTDIGAEEPFPDKLTLLNVTAENDFGWGNLLYSFSYFERKAEFRFYNDFDGDLDLTPPYGFQPFLSLQPLNSDLTTHELRFTSGGSSRLDWTVGAFVQKRDADSVGSVSVLNADGSLPTGLTTDPAFITTTTGELFFLHRTISSFLNQQAFFGEVTFHLNDRFALTGGIRFFDIKTGSDVFRTVDFAGGIGGNVCPRTEMQGTPPVLVTVACTTATRGKGDGNTLKFHLAYDITDDVLLYGQFSQGYRAGGANINSSVVLIGSSPEEQLGSVPESYTADTVDSFEVGIRSTLLNQRLALNAAAYTMKWKDIQLLGRDSAGLFAFILNGEAATIQGLEVELDASIASWLSIQAGVSFTKANLDGDGPFNRGGNLCFGGPPPVTDPVTPCANTVRHSASGKSGDPIPNVPKYTYNVSVELSREFSSGLRASLFGDYVYTGRSASAFNAFLVAPAGTTGDALSQPGDVSVYPNGSYSDQQGDYGIFDLRFGLDSKQQGWGAFVFVENVFDKRGITQVFVDGQLRRNPGYSFTERPRTIGITVNKSF